MSESLYYEQGRKFSLKERGGGGDNKHNISQDQILKGTQIIQLNCTCEDKYKHRKAFLLLV